MIRVLHVVGKMHRAGQETNIMNVYRVLDRERVAFDFLVHTTEPCDYDAEIAALCGRMYRVRKIASGVVRYVLSIRKIVRAGGYEVVHLHTAHAAGFFVLLAAKLGGARVRIAHSENNSAELPWLHKLLRPLLLRYATDRFACSEQAGRWMFGERADFRVMRNAIDTAAFAFDAADRAAARAELGLGDALVIGHVGRFVPQKNHAGLLDICAALAEKAPDFRALLIGEGELLADARAQAARLGIADNLLFLGARADVSRLMCAMDVFVFPSLFEGFGIVAIEAQATGLPCVVADTLPRATRLTPCIQYLPLGREHTGAWVDAILAAHNPDRAACAKLVADAGFDVTREAREYAAFYESAAKRQ